MTLLLNNIWEIQLEIDNFGVLSIRTSLGRIVDSNLHIYQKIKENTHIVKGYFKIFNSQTYGFEIIQNYNLKEDLTIDPLIFSTYIGGNKNDRASCIAVDSHGNSYITGYTVSSNFPSISFFVIPRIVPFR